MNINWRFLALCFAASIILLACNNLNEVELENRETEMLRNRVARYGEVIEKDQLFFVPTSQQEEHAIAQGDTLLLYFTLYALTSAGEQVLESNEIAIIRTQKIHPDSITYFPIPYIIGKTPWLKGINTGINLFAPSYRSGWLAIPYRLGFGNKPFGRVPSHTSLLFHFSVADND